MHNQQSIDHSSIWVTVLFKDPIFLFMVVPKGSPFALRDRERRERERERNHNTIYISTKNKQKPHLPI